MAVDTRKQVEALVSALCGCTKMETSADRQQVVDSLSEEIRTSVDSFADTKSHVFSIVRTCLNYENGLDELIKSIRVFENKTIAGLQVEAAVAELKKAQQLGTASTSVETPRPSTMAPQDNLALVIGVSRYAFGVDADKKPAAEQFTHLSFAAEDARAIGALLRSRGYQVAEPLIDESATLGGIMRALDKLRERCTREQSPTVVIYFAGHGARDDDNRTFLVPHDARRDELFATALWSRTFECALDEIRTERLVVFLDACHAGDMGGGGARGLEFSRFDPGRLATDMAEKGRYVVASCEAGQQSYELASEGRGHGRGIFTRYLLELLECADPQLFNDEEIDLWHLYAKLRDRVFDETKRVFNKSQTPFANFSTSTGVIITINEKLREARLLRRSQYRDALIVEVEKRGHAQSGTMKLRIKSEAQRRTETQLAQFYEILDQRFALFDGEPVDGIVADLIECFEQAYPSKAPQGPAGNRPPKRETGSREGGAGAREEARTPSPLQRNDSVIDEKPNGSIGGLAQGAWPSQALPGPGAPLSTGSQERRSVLPEDVDLILRCFPDNDLRLSFLRNRLEDLLTLPGGVAMEEVRLWQHEADKRAAKIAGLGGDPLDWDDVGARVAVRFQEAWPRAKKVESFKPSAGLLGRAL